MRDLRALLDLSHKGPKRRRYSTSSPFVASSSFWRRRISESTFLGRGLKKWLAGLPSSLAHSAAVSSDGWYGSAASSSRALLIVRFQEASLWEGWASWQSLEKRRTETPFSCRDSRKTCHSGSGPDATGTSLPE